jgi:two-component system, cell cycle response regulator
LNQRDFLTQLSGREAFQSFLEHALSAAKEAAEPLSLVMVDIDHFKSVNDSRGHQIGDDVLRAVALRLQRVARAKGETFRYGGEEFAIVLLNHSSDEALTVAERARRELSATPVAGVPVTASFGVACYPDHGSETATLTRAADQAMYAAKNRGRNLTRLHGEPPPTEQGPREPKRKTPEAGRSRRSKRRR